MPDKDRAPAMPDALTGVEPAREVSAIHLLIAELDEARAAKMLEGFNPLETEILQARAHQKTYKNITRSVRRNPKTGEPYSEIYVRKIMARLRDNLELKDTDDVTIAFMVARSRLGLPLYTDEHLSDADDLIARIAADQSVDEIIETLRSDEVRRMIVDAQTSGPRARRAKHGRHAVTIEILQWVGISFLMIMGALALGIGFNWLNSS